ncbi:carboxylesterase family protein [Nocardioides sp. C4-1]|uniref:carboxylesterase/lipase family protein n=1 Tax=Nocardioides sp. C4-1 TaxID=3151851 RepID=UPI0032669E42
MAAVAVTVAFAVTVLAGAGPSDDPDGAGPDGSRTEALAGVVTTTSGPVRGLADGRVRTWLGLPYAAPPTGDLRWRPPEPVEPWSRVRDADRYGADCVQPDRYRFGQAVLTQRTGSSEDCLYLNVSRPDDDSRDLPVVVWLHGGGFFGGSGVSAIAASGALVERGIVLVSVNYRLGRLGFFAHPALEQDVGNFGLLDQVAALEWVRANAAGFGGDARNVTLVGSSAGAMSVNALMASPAAEGLFERAISQSAPSDVQARPIAEIARREARLLPAGSVEELRSLPADRLLSSTFNTLGGDAPVLDRVLPQSSVDAFRAGREQRVPYLVGTTSEEFNDIAFRSFGVDAGALRDSLGETAAGHEALVDAYGDDYDSSVLNDLVFALPSVERAMNHAGRAPTYRYVFRGSTYSGHGAELPYVFDQPGARYDARLADEVADYWVAFARTGRPEVDGATPWPRATSQQPSAFLLLKPGQLVPETEEPHLERLSLLRVALDLRRGSAGGG